MASANRMYKLSGLSPKNGSAWWGPAHRSPALSWPGLQDGCWEPGHGCCRGQGLSSQNSQPVHNLLLPTSLKESREEERQTSGEMKDRGCCRQRGESGSVKVKGSRRESRRKREGGREEPHLSMPLAFRPAWSLTQPSAHLP